MEKTVLQKQLEKKMRDRGFNMKSLSQAAGKNETYIRDILEGRVKNPSYDSIKSIAKQLSCSVEELTESAVSSAFEEGERTEFKGFSVRRENIMVDPGMLVDSTLLVKEELEKIGTKTLGKKEISDIAIEVCKVAIQQGAGLINEDLVRYIIEVRGIKKG